MEEPGGTRADSMDFLHLAAQNNGSPDDLIAPETPPADPYLTAIGATRLLPDGTLARYEPVDAGGTRTWRFHKEFLEGPIEERALCRLDGGAVDKPKTRATLYYGRAHPEHGVDDAW